MNKHAEQLSFLPTPRLDGMVNQRESEAVSLLSVNIADTTVDLLDRLNKSLSSRNANSEEDLRQLGTSCGRIIEKTSTTPKEAGRIAAHTVATLSQRVDKVEARMTIANVFGGALQRSLKQHQDPQWKESEEQTYFSELRNLSANPQEMTEPPQP